MKVELTFPDIHDVQAATKLDEDAGLIVLLRFTTKVHPGDIARLLNLQKQNVPIFCVIGSKQAALDLAWHTVGQGGEIEESSVGAIAAGKE